MEDDWGIDFPDSDEDEAAEDNKKEKVVSDDDAIEDIMDLAIAKGKEK